VLYEVAKPTDGTEEDVRVILGGNEYSPIGISSMILEKLKEDTEMRENDKVTHAVITVPAYFTDKQREATRRAGWNAGFIVKDVLDEPTAAAIAYGVDAIPPEEVNTILVYDLGGGTFDVSVLTIAGGTFAQLDIEGNMWLGGDDFDQKIMNYILQHIKDEYEVDGRGNLRFMITLKKECEKAKKQLSSMSKTVIFLPGKLEDEDGNFIDVDVEITRERFERMIEKEVKSTIDLVHAAIENVNLTIDQIDNVLLVGGSTMIPMVQRALIDVFGEDKILRNVDPMKCVAQGAGILAARRHLVICPECKTENPENAGVCSNCSLNFDEVLGRVVTAARVTAQPYGIQVSGDKFEVIIPKGTPYPTEPVTRKFYPSAANMRRIKVPIYCGFEEVASTNEIMGTVWMVLPKDVSIDTPVDVTFALDDEGILKKAVVELKGGHGRMVEKAIDRGSDWTSVVERDMKAAEEELENKRKRGDASTETIEKIRKKIDEVTEVMNKGDKEGALEDAGKIKKEVEKIGGVEEKEWKQKAEGLCNYTEFILTQYNWLLDSDTNDKLRKLVETLKNAVKYDDQELGEHETDELNKAINALPEIVQILMTAIIAEGMLKETDPKGADILRAIRRELEDELRRGDLDNVRKNIDKMMPLLNKMMEGRKPEEIGAVPEELLRAAKKGGTI
ncbi:MAG: Hsp70 family protein, partial [Thermoplasmatales archaeon]|nr:Hsp70 family protein [Thermoplasmatales archaeon]